MMIFRIYIYIYVFCFCMCGLGWQGKWGENGTAFYCLWYNFLKIINLYIYLVYLFVLIFCWFLLLEFPFEFKGRGKFAVLWASLVVVLFGLCGWRETKAYLRATQGRIFLYIWDKVRIRASHWASIPFLSVQWVFF